MATIPQFMAVPRCETKRISVANTNRDGTGAMETVFTGGINGSKIETIIIQAIGNTTPGMVRFFISDETSNILFFEIPIPAITVSESEPAFRAEIKFDDFVIPPGKQIKASTHKSESFNIIIFGGDF